MPLHFDSAQFRDLQSKIVVPLRPPVTTRKILEGFVNIDINSETVSKIVQKNQYVEFMLLQQIKALGLKDTTPTLRAAIALLGMQKVRDFICSLQMVRQISKKYPAPDKDGKFEIKIGDYIPYATRTEEFVNLRRMEHADMAYAAGMVFDRMLYIGKELFQAGKPYEEYVAEVYKHGLRAARIGSELVKTQKHFGYSKYVFAACLLHDIGKLAMDLLFPTSTPNSFHVFTADIGKKPVTREVIHFVEAKRFGITHEYFSAHLAYHSGLFRDIERALLFHHETYLMKMANRDVYNFGALIALASNMANNLRAPKDTNDPIYQAWLTPELADFKIDRKILLLIMAKVGSDRI